MATERRPLSAEVDRFELARRARVPGQAMALFDTGRANQGWSQGPLLALSPTRLPLRLNSSPLGLKNSVVGIPVTR